MKEKGKNHRHRMDKAKYEIIIEERRERREDLDNRYIYIYGLLISKPERTNGASYLEHKNVYSLLSLLGG